MKNVLHTKVMSYTVPSINSPHFLFHVRFKHCECQSHSEAKERSNSTEWGRLFPQLKGNDHVEASGAPEGIPVVTSSFLGIHLTGKGKCACKNLRVAFCTYCRDVR